MSWRHKEWYRFLEKEVEEIPEPTLMEGDIATALLLFSEAGADAMLAALKAGGEYVKNDGLNPYGMVLAGSLKRGEKGWMVFIPDEDKEGG